jgi:hypothetical protein
VNKQGRWLVFCKRNAHNSPFPPIAGVFEESEGIFDQGLLPGGAAAVRISGVGGRNQFIAGGRDAACAATAGCWADDPHQWFRSYGNEHWEFDDDGLMRRRQASINDVAIRESERRFRWPLPARDRPITPVFLMSTEIQHHKTLWR